MSQHSLCYRTWSKHSNVDCFLLVRDVASYAHFLPNCTEGQVIKELPWGRIARLRFSFFGLKQEWITRNQEQFPDRISLELVEGPLEHFTGTWTFEPQGSGTQMSFSCAYDCGSAWLNHAFQGMMQPIVPHIMHGFQQEADRRYAGV